MDRASRGTIGRARLRTQPGAASFRLLAGLLAIWPAAAGARPPALQAGRQGELVLTAGPAGSRLRFPSGTALELELPSGAEISVLAAEPGGWIAAGTEVVDGRPRLLLLAGDERQAHALPAPVSAAATLGEPVPLVGERGLAGLAWLEGDSRSTLAVRAAAWDGAAFESAQEVAPPAAGSQLALSGTVLADGSWLLLWSAFDGQDDEILWSRRAKATWSAPARLAPDNAVPDITPALLALPAGGAVAAWSRYDDGHYRLQLARFDGRAWAPPSTLGPAGALYPTFVADSREALLLVRSAVPRGWIAVSLDAAGTPRRLAAVEAETAERPLLRPDGQSLHLDWPARGEEATALWRPLP